MNLHGDRHGFDNWTTHVIKWRAGYDDRGVFNGEKRDQFMFSDVIATGTLTSWQTSGSSTGVGETVYLAVVWFENPGGRSN